MFLSNNINEVNIEFQIINGQYLDQKIIQTNAFTLNLISSNPV